MNRTVPDKDRGYRLLGSAKPISTVTDEQRTAALAYLTRQNANDIAEILGLQPHQRTGDHS